ncbi:MAG: hypothetical protein Q9219_006231 [cf. Caloplaca sp. 3 TL-2023]
MGFCQEWETSLSGMIGAAHATADLVFRGFSEDTAPWLRSDSYNSKIASLIEVCKSSNDASNLPGWQGISAGLERLNGQLLTVQSFLHFPTAFPVTVPVSKLVGLIDRVLSVLPPSEKGSKDPDAGTPTKPEIDRDEREAVWTWLPSLHVSALNTAERLVCRLQEGSAAYNQQLMVHAVWIFEHEYFHVQIRQAVYKLLPLILTNCASASSRSIPSSLAICLRSCCDDLLPLQADLGHMQGNVVSSITTNSTNAMNVDAYLNKSKTTSSLPERQSSLQDAAALLLSAALEYLPSDFLNFSIRTKIDRTAVLAQNELLLQSSVLNPPSRRGTKQHSSLLPLLSRQFPESHGTEALIRPRLPPLQIRPMDLPDQDSDKEIDDRMYVEEDANVISAATIDDHGTQTSPTDEKKTESPSMSMHPPPSFPRGTVQQDIQSNSHAKRMREPDPPDNRHITLEEPEHLLPLEGEPKQKCIRTDGQEIYVQPAIDDDLPTHKMITPPDMPATTAQVPSSIDAFVSHQKGTENQVDDDSDDSSIPPIDPTLATDDEEDERYDAAD